MHLALLVNYKQEVLCSIPGSMVNRAGEGYRREAKTDARDALVIAEQACIRQEPDAVRRRVPSSSSPPSSSSCSRVAVRTWSVTAPAPSTARAPR
ncbi:IS110 family transposase [Streptomyces sp. HC44]|uniref:IS110 family transposase n=1 Tax=Streptomyces scabichelini TaxID=2711217 RepID=A0A6G4V1V1_9ACTN|nr:IS110 family transposase [Streptomyces scabichelini]